jgi:protein-S-isoprenylcysteine O-methyltransferase Ste14
MKLPINARTIERRHGWEPGSGRARLRASAKPHTEQHTRASDRLVGKVRLRASLRAAVWPAVVASLVAVGFWFFVAYPDGVDKTCILAMAVVATLAAWGLQVRLWRAMKRGGL